MSDVAEVIASLERRLRVLEHKTPSVVLGTQDTFVVPAWNKNSSPVTVGTSATTLLTTKTYLYSVRADVRAGLVIDGVASTDLRFTAQVYQGAILTGTYAMDVSAGDFILSNPRVVFDLASGYVNHSVKAFTSTGTVAIAANGAQLWVRPRGTT